MKRSKAKPKPQAALPEADAERPPADDDLLPTEEELDDPEALHEAEADLGINQWIDPDTGAPAEDSVPRLEDH